MSPDCTTVGSSLIPNRCLRPSIFTVTDPPPEELSTTVSCIFFCKASYWRLACDIKSWRLNPLINLYPQILRAEQRKTPIRAGEGSASLMSVRTVSLTGVFSLLCLCFVVNHRSDLSPEFVHHTADYWLLFGSAATAPARPWGDGFRRLPLRRCTGHNPQLDRPT